MKVSKCPNCGFQQHDQQECLRCGIVFEKYYARASFLSGPSELVETQSEKNKLSVWEYLGILFRVFRWGSLAVSAMLLYLVLNPSPPPLVAQDPEAVRSAELKMAQAQRAVQRGRAKTVSLTEAEVNAWIHSNLDVGSDPAANFPETPQPTAASLGGGSMKASAGELETVEDLRSRITDLRIAVINDLVKTYVRFKLYGKDMSFELEGHLYARNGFLRLDPVAGKLGSFPIPSATLGSAASRIFESDENRERFRLPDYVRSVSVAGGELMVEVDGS